ncbi:MAG: OsmC family peroxiredoxin [Rudaea sp.]
MPVMERTAKTVWQGNLMQGNGTVSVGSNAFGPLPVTFAARTERADGKTSPEELIAAAHATCFAMAFSSNLAKAGKPPEELTVSATCTLDRREGHLSITKMQLDVKARVPGIDKAEFEQIAHEAGRSCPVSRALSGNVDIRVNAELEQTAGMPR